MGPDVDVVAAFASLSEHGYRHIPVVDADELVGIVSIRDLMRIAQIQPAENLAHEIPRGLEGVVVAETDIGDVRGLEGFYHYRQYSAVDLAESRTLEDVWHLMFEGTLPSLAERAAFAARVAPLRAIPDPVAGALPEVARLGTEAPPLDMLRTTISLLGAHLGFRPSLDVDAAQLKDDALRVCAVVPTLLTSIHRLQHGLEPIAPDPELAYAANYLYMLTGTVPEPDHARAVEQYLISTIDHGFNASTFTARVITSTGADLAAAVVGAIGALSGPLHGGAPSRALDMLDAIGTLDNAEPWLRAAVERGDRLMGFGHRVYKTDDPRSVMLRGVAERLGGPNVELAEQIEAKAIEVLAELKPGRRLYTNVEFYAGIVMDRCGLPPRDVHPDVRVEPRHRLVRSHPRAGRRQPPHPPQRPVRRPTPTPTPASPPMSRRGAPHDAAGAGRRRRDGRRGVRPKASASPRAGVSCGARRRRSTAPRPRRTARRERCAGRR